MRAMRAERFGSYSIVATRPGTPGLSRLKSISRNRRLVPPPRWRAVTLPWLLRPPVRFTELVSDFSGSLRVISVNCETEPKRRPEEVGLYCRIAIVLTGSYPDPASPAGEGVTLTL